MCITKSIETLSPREKEVLDELLQGSTNQEIADKLSISLRMVQDHVHMLLIKTRKGSRLALVVSVYKALIDGTFARTKGRA